MKPLTFIRKTAIAKANSLQRAAQHLDSLRPAFALWAAGEIYVCKKTGDYRFRFGADSKSVAPWSALARSVFSTPEAFAFAALVLAEPQAELPAPAAPVRIVRAPSPTRVDVIALAAQSQAA